MFRELGGKIQIHGSQQVQYLRQAIRKLQLSNCNPISISCPIPLGLNLFYSIHSHSWYWAHALPGPHHISNLPSVLLLRQYFSFGTEGVQEVMGRASQPCNQSNGEQLLSWDVVTFSSYTNLCLSGPGNNGFRSDCVPYLGYSVAKRGVVSGQINSWSRLNDGTISEFLTWLSKPISKEFLMLAPCSMCIVLERAKWKVCLPFLALSAWMFAFYTRSSESWYFVS